MGVPIPCPLQRITTSNFSPPSLTCLQLAYERLINGQVREALQTYKKAFNQDETSVAALAGIIHCQILDGQLSEAEQQLEFLAEVGWSAGVRSQA